MSEKVEAGFFTSKLKIILYGLTYAPVGLAFWCMQGFIAPLYAQKYGLSLAFIGTVFLIARTWDGLTAPVIGVLVDRVALGPLKRRLWMLLGLPAFTIGVFKLFMPRTSADRIYFLAWLLVFYTGQTILHIAVNTWGTQLSDSYNGRNFVFGVIGWGALAAQLSAQAYVLATGAGTVDTSQVTTTCAVIILALAFVLIPTSTVLVPEGSTRKKEPKADIVHALRGIAKNRPFLIFQLAYLAAFIATTFHETSLVFIVEDRLQLPGKAVYAFLTMGLFAIFAIPATQYLSRKVGKHRALAVAVGMQLGSYAVVFLIPPGRMDLMIFAYAINGLGQLALWYLPPSIVADTTDYHRLLGEGEHTGLLISLTILTTKIGVAVGSTGSFWVLAASGYDPAAAARDATGVITVGLWIPLALGLPCLASLWWYPIGARQFEAIQRILTCNRAITFRRLHSRPNRARPQTQASS